MDIVNKMIGFYKKAVLENYFNFEGRAAVGEYWWFVLANVIVSILVNVVDGILGTMVLGLVYSLAVMLPSLGAAARRLHDTGKSGLLLLWSLIPILGGIYVIYLLIQKGETAKNMYGEAVK